jgi:hypothetical protein
VFAGQLSHNPKHVLTLVNGSFAAVDAYEWTQCSLAGGQGTAPTVFVEWT